jgi:hypothetical protein
MGDPLTNQAFAFTRVCDRSRGLLFPESLHGLGGRRHFVESRLCPPRFWTDLSVNTDLGEGEEKKWVSSKTFQ